MAQRSAAVIVDTIGVKHQLCEVCIRLGVLFIDSVGGDERGLSGRMHG